MATCDEKDAACLQLVGCDGKSIGLNRQEARLSTVLTGMLDDAQMCAPLVLDGEDDNRIPISASSDALHVIKECLARQVASKDSDRYDVAALNEVALRRRPNDFLSAMDEWLRARLTSLPLPLMYEVIRVAHFLNFPALFLSCCMVIASQLENKTVEEMRSTFHIENDFSPEEEEKLRKEYEWCLAHDS
jgi:hypothetical protein